VEADVSETARFFKTLASKKQSIVRRNPEAHRQYRQNYEYLKNQQLPFFN
jgi:hypothetical protein